MSDLSKTNRLSRRQALAGAEQEEAADESLATLYQRGHRGGTEVTI